MLRTLAMLLLLVPALAVAQPLPPARPDEKPVPWPPLFAALRIGWHSASLDSCCYTLSGSGVSIDGEAGYRFDEWFSLSGVFAYSTLHGYAQTDAIPQMPPVYTDEHMIDVGVRATLRYSLAFAGVGIGLEAYDASRKGLLDRAIELHAGIMLPRIYHVAPELFVAKVYGAGNWENGTPDIESTRIALGIEAW